jgi:MFS family permease
MFDLDKRLTKYIFFGFLNFPKGILLTLTLIIIPIYLYEKSIPIHIITIIVGLVSFPWIIKIVWGWIIDHYISFGRKIFIIIGGTISSLSLCAITLFDPETFLFLFVFFLFTSHIGLLFLDTAKTAWAIDIIDKNERGKINGIMFSFQFLIMAISTLFLSFISKIIHYNFAFILSGILILSFSMYTYFFNEGKKEKKVQQIKTLVTELKKNHIRLISLFALITPITGGIIILTAPLYIKDIFQFDIGQIGIFSVLFLLLRAIGSFSGGWAADRYGRKISSAIFLSASIILFPFFTILDSWEGLFILYSTIGFFLGGIQTTMSTIFMDSSNKEIAATHYSMYASFFNIGRLTGETFSGIFIISFGFSRVFLICAWIFGISLWLLFFLRK